MLRNAMGVAIALSLSLAAGCQAPMSLHQMKQPWFALSEAGSVGVSTRSDLTGGRLTVRFDRELAGMRRVQAVVADVAKVVVTVRTQDGAEVSETVLKAALNNGQASVTFSGLAPGSATVTIAAYDAAGVNIGSTSKVASIVAGQVASVDVTLQLIPSVVAGDTGGGWLTTGGLAANVALSDGLTMPTPAIGDTLGQFDLDGYPWSVAVDSAGQAWVGGGDGNYGGKVWQLAPNGTVLRTMSYDGPIFEVARDGQGQVWVLESRLSLPMEQVMKLHRYSATGVRQSSLTISPTRDIQILADAQGRVWAFDTGSKDLMKMATDGTIETQIRLSDSTGGFASDFAIGANGEVWVVYPQKERVCRYNSAGSLLSSASMPTGRKPGVMAIDAQGNAWVGETEPNHPSRTQVWQLSPSGALTRTFEAEYNGFANITSHQGDVWFGSSPIYRLPAGGGALIELPDLNLLPVAMAAGSSGMWMLSGKRVVRVAL